MFTPNDDGVSHINIYSKGKTRLGRLLSNFHYQPFNHPVYGSFHSVEGMWYWLSCRDDRLRYLSGSEAKREGRALREKDNSGEPWFYQAITEALRIKIMSNPELLGLIKENELPYAHYYTKHCPKTGEELSVEASPKHLWVVREIEGIVADIKQEPVMGRLL